MIPHWCWAQNIVSHLESDTKINYAARRLWGTVHGCHCPAKLGRSILYGVLFLAAHPFQIANFRVSAQVLPKAHSWQLGRVCWPIVDGWLSHTAGPSVMDPFDCPNWIPYCFHSGVHMESMESIWNEFMEWNFQMDSVLFKSDLMPPQNSIQNSYVNIDIVLIIFT